MIERKIILGLITSSDYLKQIKPIWNYQFIGATVNKHIARWCWEYFDKYDKAPGSEIESIFLSKLKDKKIPPDLAEEIEEDILPALDALNTKDPVNVEYLIDATQKHFSEKNLTYFSETITALIAAGELLEAEKMAGEYKPIVNSTEVGLDFSSDALMHKIDRAFINTNESLIGYNGALGEFWNSQLIKGGFVALMGTEKRGKTFWLLDLALMACKQNRKVVFFQAGDMTEAQQLMRICIHLAGRSNVPKYCAKHFAPVKDCIHNQLNNCKREERTETFGIFEGETEEYLKSKVTMEDLTEAYADAPDYKPCTDCEEYTHNKWGAVWIKEVEEVLPLKASEAKVIVKNWLNENEGRFKLSSHANDTLSIKQIKALLAVWEKQDNFIPDVIVIDYADLLVPETKEFRHGQNEIWKGLRALSQAKGQPLVITATQADAKGYEQNRLKMKNFSEDKRKYAHVTALWGLNQDKDGIEKQKGIMVLNEIVIREGDFAKANEVKVLQDLWRGRPHTGSFW